MGNRIRTALLACALLSASVVAPERARAAQALDPDDALLFDARVGPYQVGNGVRAFQLAGDAICLDLADVIDALQLAVEPSPDGRRATGWAFAETYRIDIDRDKAQARYGGHYASIGDGDIHDSRSGWCVSAATLGKWLGVRFDADVGNAILTVVAPGPLPVEAAARRGAQADRLSTTPAGAGAAPMERLVLPYRPWRTPAIDASASFSLEGRDGTVSARSARYEIFAAGEIAWASSDLRLVSDAARRPASLRMRLYRADADADLLGPLQATEAVIGDVDGFAIPLVANAASGRGLALGNRPLGLSAEFDTVSLTGALPQGWDAELYRNGELLRATGGDGTGRYAFRDVQLRYGVNQIDIVRYGPQGQVRRERRVYNIAAQMPRPGERWWSASLLQAGRDLIRFGGAATLRSGLRMAVAVEQGIGRGTSLGLAFIRSAGDAGRPGGDYMQATLRAGLSRMLGEASVAHDLAGGTAARINLVGQALGGSLSLEAARNWRLASERLDPDLRQWVTVALDRAVHVGGVVLPVRFDLRSARSDNGATMEARARASYSGRTMSVSASAGWSRSNPRDGPPADMAVAGLLFNTRLAGTRLRGEANWRLTPRPQLLNAQIAANRAIGLRDEVQLSAGYSGPDRRLVLGGNISRHFDHVALGASAIVDSRRRWSLGLTLTMSVGPDGEGRFGRWSAGSQARGATIAVRQYRDHNGDGARQPDEPYIPVGRLLVNGMPLAHPATEEDGAAPVLLEGLDAGRPVSIALDEAGIADPFDMPSSAGVITAPRAGQMVRLELGLAGSASLEAMVEQDGRPLAGETVELVDGEGRVAYHARVEFDGLLSFERVRYGRYRLRLARGGILLDAAVDLSAQHPGLRLGRLTVPSGPTQLARRP